jgi:hypothetical protein
LDLGFNREAEGIRSEYILEQQRVIPRHRGAIHIHSDIGDDAVFNHILIESDDNHADCVRSQRVVIQVLSSSVGGLTENDRIQSDGIVVELNIEL